MREQFTRQEVLELPRLFRFAATSGYFNRDLMKRFEKSFEEFIELEFGEAALEETR